MEFSVDNDDTVLVDGLPEPGYSVVTDLATIPGLTITAESFDSTDADPHNHTHAGAISTLSVTYKGMAYQVSEVATAEDMEVSSLDAYAQQSVVRRAIICLAPVAGTEAIEIDLAAIESRFTRGIFISQSPYN